VSIRLLTGLTAFALLAGPALANDKKKGAAAPETTPAPVIVPAPAMRLSVPLPPPALHAGERLLLPTPVEQQPKPAPIAPQLLPAPRTVEPAGLVIPPLAPGITLPSPCCPANPHPQYFPEDPQFPLPRELTYQEEAERLLRASAAQVVVRTYSVGDLVVPLPKAGQPANQLPKTLEAQLIKSITTTVSPKSWKAAGGTGTLEYYPIGMALIVNAVPEVHTALAKYLDHVRQMNDLQIQVEIKVVTMSSAALAGSGLGADFLPTKDQPDAIRTRMKFLSDDQAAQVLLSHSEVNTLSAPRMAILNGQEGSVRVGQVEHFLTGVTVQSLNNALLFIPRNEPHETGLEVKVEGTVSADKRFVRLAINGRARDVAVRPVAQIPVTVPVPGFTKDGKPAEKAPFTQFIEDPKFVTRSVNETVTVPDGGTVVFYGGKADFERKIREKLPMLADVPVLAELFAKDKKETSSDHLLIFATTRIVNPQAATEECDAPCCGKGDRLGKLMAEYAHACKEGKSAEALKLAVECLSIDPTCFGKSK
jgi:hypothetical protein